MNYAEKITRIIVDMYKPNGPKNKSNVDVYDMSDSFNARVGDEQIPLMIEYRERGIIERMTSESLTPFAMGYVGQPDEHGKVTAETGVAVSYHGSSDDIIGAGKVKMDLPGAMFPQEGMFYGFFGLENSAGKRITSNDVCFEVKNGNPDMYVDSMPFRSELQKLLDWATAQADTQFGDIKAKWEALRDTILEMIKSGDTDLTSLKNRIGLAEADLDKLLKMIDDKNLLTLDDFNKLKDDLLNRMSVVEHQDILNYRNKLKYKTISATIYNDSETISNDQLNHIQATGADLTLVTMVTVDNANDSSPTDISDTTFNDLIDRANKIGLKIGMLKPHIGIAGEHDSFSRKDYLPDDPDGFFENWKDLMIHYADLAKNNGVPILCIGCEMFNQTDVKYLTKWQDIYNTIKAKYPDLLITYAMSQYEFFEFENQGQIASVVDYIGMNIYPSYIASEYKSGLKVSELKGAWWNDWNGNQFMEQLDEYYDEYQKPIFVTETGLMPYKDGLAHLISSYIDSNEKENYDAQAIGYKAALEAIAKDSHVIGVSIWHASKPFSFISEDVSTVTPSEKVLTQYFKGGKI